MGFWERVEQIVGQGVSTSREILDKAKAKAKDLGEMGLLKYEIQQLERQAEQQLMQLGGLVYDKLAIKEQSTVSREALKDLLANIGDLRQRIEEREQSLKRLEGKPS